MISLTLALLLVAFICWVLEELGNLPVRFSILFVILSLVFPLVR